MENNDILAELPKGPLRPTMQTRITSTELANLNELGYIFKVKNPIIIRMALKYYYKEVKGIKD